MVEQHKNYCPACGHTMAKPKRGLSTIEFRRTVQKCADRDNLRENIYKLIKIFRNITQDARLTVTFTQDFESRLNDNLQSLQNASEEQNIDAIKLWLLEQINKLDKDIGEKALYRFLYNFYLEKGINEPFAIFYDNYLQFTDNPLSKNCVSRALNTLGLKTKMVRMIVNSKEKNAISIQATAEELHDIFRKNGIDY